MLFEFHLTDHTRSLNIPVCELIYHHLQTLVESRILVLSISKLKSSYTLFISTKLVILAIIMIVFEGNASKIFVCGSLITLNNYSSFFEESFLII